MNTRNNNAARSKEETINFFRSLPAPVPASTLSSAPHALMQADQTDQTDQTDRAEPLPMVLAFSSNPQSDADTNNLAEVGKDEAIVIAFADGVSTANRKAVMLSMKFAEAYARAKKNESTDRIEWMEHYSQAMFHGGWAELGGYSFSEYTTRDSSLTMDSVVIELISAIAGPNKVAVLNLLNIVLDRMQGDESLMKLFEYNSQKGLTSSFRIMPCLESPTGIPVTYLLAVEVDFSKHEGRTLFWKWSVSTLHIRQMTTGVNFDIDAHNDNKQLIRDYLKGNAEDFFAGLPRA